MTHFGIICLEATGHLNTVFPIGREIKRRGHTVTIFSTLGAKARAVELGFNFRGIGEKEYLGKAFKSDTPTKQRELLRCAILLLRWRKRHKSDCVILPRLSKKLAPKCF